MGSYLKGEKLFSEIPRTGKKELGAAAKQKIDKAQEQSDCWHGATVL